MATQRHDARFLLSSLHGAQDRLRAGDIALSVVAPCFNEIEALPELYRRVTNVCREQAGEDYEVVLINDGSSDGTWSAILALAAADPHVVGVNLSRNHGHQLALSAGLSVCKGWRVL